MAVPQADSLFMRDGNTFAATRIRSLLVLWFVVGICCVTQIRAQEMDSVNVRVDSVDASVHARVDEAKGNTGGTQRVGAKRSSSTTWTTHENSGASLAHGKVERSAGSAQSKLAGSAKPAALATGNSGLKPQNGANKNGYPSAVGAGTQEELARSPGTDMRASGGSPFKTDTGSSPFTKKQRGLTRSDSLFATSNHVRAPTSQPHGKAAAKKTPTTVTGKTSKNSATKKK